ncbi:hypothetical protein BJ322DRAFT_1013305 [Thelephora terrestris]|uniref:Uncharacterized protein n=1 Tax=Thelephora terrestris TaxID=56493 RepID=A0A9P6H5J5_9AGAM|nr:hypothetical protein BJ322DRAFT_1013305 [Thelephora terrestris]
MSRLQRQKDADEAHQIQVKAGFLGAAQWTAFGVAATSLAHVYSPFFRKQTLPLKAFLVTITAVFGFTLSADQALLRFETRRRIEDSAIRKEARMELAKRGLVPTETEIAKWREANGK